MLPGRLLIATLCFLPDPAGLAAAGPSSTVVRPPDFDLISAIVGRGRYMESPPCSAEQSPARNRCCAPVAAADPALEEIVRPYAAFREAGAGHTGLRNCRYYDSSTRIEAQVVMLNPTAERVTEWTISACSKARARSLLSCATWVWEDILSGSGTQFAVTGAVAEENLGCGDAAPEVGYLFRDGVTVRLEGTARVCTGDKAWLADGPPTYLTARVKWTAIPGPGRVAMLNRQQYSAYFRQPLPDDHPVGAEIPWLRIVREAHMKALSATSHEWLDADVVARLPACLRHSD